MKVKTRSNNSKLSDAKRAAIINAGLEEFKRNGYPVTSMDGIASRAGVSKRTVYNHFPGKQHLFKTIVKELFNDVRKTSTIPYETEMPLQDQLKRIAYQQIEQLTSQEFVELARITFSEYIRSPELAREVFEGINNGNPTFYKWVTDAMEHGKIIKIDPIIPAKQFVSMIKAFFLWPQLFGGQLPDKSKYDLIINTTIEMFLKFYESGNQP